MRRLLIVCLAALLAACAVNPMAVAGGEGPPPPPRATQTCPDGTVLLENEACPVRLPPLPPAPTANGHSANGHPAGENGSSDGPSVNVTGGTRAPASEQPSRGARNSYTSAGPDDGIQLGKGAFAKPPPMEVGSWSRLEFLVAPDAAGIAAEAGGRETTAVEDIFIAPVMRVTLLPDPNFDVSPQTPVEQRIGLDKRASWHWNVKPKEKGGTFTLVARVQVLEVGEVVDDYTRRVDVSVTVGRRQRVVEEIGFLKKLGDQLGELFGSWQKALVALAALIAACFALWRVIKSRGASAGATG